MMPPLCRHEDLSQCSSECEALGLQFDEWLRNALGKMPTRCRRAITLRKAYGHSQAQIAQEMELTPREVEDALIKALAFLSREMLT